MRGRFIVIEGIDGAGTTTQVSLVSRRLRKMGGDVLVTHEPTRKGAGRIIRRLLAKNGRARRQSAQTMALLFAADRSAHVDDEILPALESGRDVISDRYLLSSLAYQSLGMPLGRVKELNKHFPKPDLTVFLSVPVRECLKRLASRGGERTIYENEGTMRKLAARYRSIIRKDAAFLGPIRILDGRREADMLCKEILALVSAIPSR